MAMRKYDARVIARLAAVVGAATTLSACSGEDQRSDEPAPSETSSVAQAVIKRAVPGDYDGDGKADLALFRPQNVTSPGGWGANQWHVALSGGGELAVQGGDATDIFVPGDYDGDGRNDFAFFNPQTGDWNVTYAAGGGFVRNYGAEKTDRPVPGDYDGDGKTDLAIFRINPGTCGSGPELHWACWHIQPSGGGNDIEIDYGDAGDTLVPADYNGDGKTDLGLFRRPPPGSGVAASATWYVYHPTTGKEDNPITLGTSSDRPVPADYDFDGKVDKAVFSPSTGNWTVRTTSVFSPRFLSGTLGTGVDRVVPAAYDGGAAEMAYFRPSDGTWHIQPFRSGEERVVAYGEATDRPLNGRVAIYPRSNLGALPLDFDGDRREDLAYWTPSSGAWSAIPSNGGSYFVPSWGDPNDKPAPGDYDGDGIVDPGLLRLDFSGAFGHVWYWVLLSQSGEGKALSGLLNFIPDSAQVPVPGDYDGDGITDAAWFYKGGSTTGYWEIRLSTTGGIRSVPFGQNAGDIPVPGDYDNDGKTDLAVYRPNERKWYVHPAKGGSDIVVNWGDSNVVPKPGDFDGDGATDFCYFSNTDGSWHYLLSATNGSGSKAWGNSQDRLVPRDYDGDGITDPGLWRAWDGKWHVAPSTGADDPNVVFGSNTDRFL